MKVAIVAKGGTSSLAPWRNPEWEIWGLPWISYPRVTRLFDLHTQECVDCCPVEWFQKGEWVEKGRKQFETVPVYCDSSRAHLYPDAVPYPLEAVQAFLPYAYLENSIAYQLALAMYEGAEEIGLYGVHMMGRPEFVYERPSVTYLVGLAQGKGIRVSIPPGSPLFMSAYEAGRYGPKEVVREYALEAAQRVYGCAA